MMVPETGIEPVTFALEGRCSSTELLGLREPEKLIEKAREVKGFYTKKFLSIIQESNCYDL